MYVKPKVTSDAVGSASIKAIPKFKSERLKKTFLLNDALLTQLITLKHPQCELQNLSN
jgi:hypothetical protein